MAYGYAKCNRAFCYDNKNKDNIGAIRQNLFDSIKFEKGLMEIHPAKSHCL
uniref:Uncharacterized protein n=1 Tax=Solanum lycopersicum TaxID=4081 RepID=A0A3Q7FYG5_SOLLC